jgi:hypothetical protein
MHRINARIHTPELIAIARQLYAEMKSYAAVARKMKVKDGGTVHRWLDPEYNRKRIAAVRKCEGRE